MKLRVEASIEKPKKGRNLADNSNNIAICYHLLRFQPRRNSIPSVPSFYVRQKPILAGGFVKTNNRDISVTIPSKYPYSVIEYCPPLCIIFRQTMMCSMGPSLTSDAPLYYRSTRHTACMHITRRKLWQWITSSQNLD